MPLAQSSPIFTVSATVPYRKKAPRRLTSNPSVPQRRPSVRGHTRRHRQDKGSCCLNFSPHLRGGRLQMKDSTLVSLPWLIRTSIIRGVPGWIRTMRGLFRATVCHPYVGHHPATVEVRHECEDWELSHDRKLCGSLGKASRSRRYG